MIPSLVPKASLSPEEVRQGLNRVIGDGVTTHALLTLTGGIFIVAFALQMGASNTIIGLLAAIPPLAALIQIPAIYLINRVRNRRLICVTTSLVSRTLWLGIAALPFFFLPGVTLPIFIVLLVVYMVISSVGQCSWSSWMRDLVPRERMGTFFSRRWSISMAVGIVLSLAAGYFIDLWGKSHPWSVIDGYSYIFIAGVLIGYVGVHFLATIPEPRMAEPNSASFITVFRASIAQENFRKLLRFLALWNFAVNLAAPFFTVYLIKNIHLDLTMVIVLSVLSQVVSVFSYPLWGGIIDRYSNKTALSIAGPLFMIAILGWTFTTMPGPYPLTIPLLVVLHILMGLSTAGVTLSAGYIGLKLATKEAATTQLAVISVTNSLVAGIAPVIGGFFVDFLATSELDWTLTWKSAGPEIAIQTLSLQNWDFFFLIAFLIGLFSLHLLAYVHEVGEVNRQLVVHELLHQVRREMRNFSTAGGLRLMLHLPLTAMESEPRLSEEIQRLP
ncbi:MAG: MFS transporter [Methanomicrobiales archaeon]|nr:MFS transporter [Methanomicrobiales archaeon]